jgi:hypothetical protein
LVVLKDNRSDKAVTNGRKGELVGKLLQKDTHWEELAHCHAKGHVFGGGGTESDFGLELAGPNNRATVKGEYKTSTRFDRYRVLFILIAMHPSKIGVNIAVQSCCQVGGEHQSSSPSFDKVSDNALDGLSVGLAGTMAEACHLMYSKLNVRPCIRGDVEEHSNSSWVAPFFIKREAFLVGAEWLF